MFGSKCFFEILWVLCTRIFLLSTMQNAAISPYNDILQRKEAQFEAAIENGDISPFILPRDLLPLGILILALIIRYPRHGVFRYIRHLAFFTMSYLALANMSKCRILGLGNGYAVGLGTAWMVIWGAAFLVFNDPQRNFRRVERYVVDCPNPEEKENGYDGNSAAAIDDYLKNRPSNIRSRILPDVAKRLPLDLKQRNDTPLPQPRRIRLFRWQGYPESISHRIGWVLDLIINLRGPGWNWRISTLPSLPEYVPKQKDNIYTKPARDDQPSMDEAVSHFRSTCITLAISYLGLDVLKVLMMRDPYFWGELSSLPPHPYGKFLAISPLLVRSYHIFLPFFGLLAALIFFSSLATVILLGTAILFPQIQDWTSVPIEAAWLHPNGFGRFPEDFFDYGISGLWGCGWHQFFRFGFGAPSRWLFAHLPTSLQSTKMKLVLKLFIAFTLSGSIHACGSYTQIGPTKPFSGSFMFFAFQGPAVLLQHFLSKTIMPSILPFKLPPWLLRIANICLILGWALFSGPLLADDLARGGTWLMEPVPVSLVRGLGFGSPGEGWWCWNGKWFKWWSEDRWWDSGIQVL